MMNENRLIQNVTDQIKEAQLKLGYVQETVRLYFPLESLNSILGTAIGNISDMLETLRKNPAFVHSVLGTLQFYMHENRIEVRIPPEGARYVNECVSAPAFLKTWIQLFSENHSLSIQEICGCFTSFSPDYVCEKMRDDGDFDYVLHFQDPSIDPYYYCVKMEMGHTVYHRFTRKDYEHFME